MCTKVVAPDVFAVALLNSMPMGFYQPAQIVIDARRHGVEVREADINHSHWDNVFEQKSGDYFAIRLGFRQVSGLRREDMELLISARIKKYPDITALCDIGLSLAVLERLADADAFRSLGLDRRQALWEVSALADRPVALFEGKPSESALEAQVTLPLMSMEEHLAQDYASTALSLKAHPVSLMREKLGLLRALSSLELAGTAPGGLVKTAGLVLVRQRPGTAKGVCFITLEDESGTINLVIFANIFEKYRKEIISSRVLLVEGKLQRESGVTHVIVTQCFNLAGLFKGIKLPEAGELSLFDTLTVDRVMPDFPGEQAGGDQIGTVIPKGRNFK